MKHGMHKKMPKGMPKKMVGEAHMMKVKKGK